MMTRRKVTIDDLIMRNHIYYLRNDVRNHPELGFPDVHRIRYIISQNEAVDPLWAKLQTYDPKTCEPIQRINDDASNSTTSASSPSSPHPEIVLNTPTINTVPNTSVLTNNPPPTSYPTPSVSYAHPLSSPISIHSTNNTPHTPVSQSTPSPNISTNSNTPQIAKSFRSPPPSDYFVNNAANLSYVSISQYFKLPLHEACVALRVDESSLKKRCRELGIRRWPYRKRCALGGKGGDKTQQVEDTSESGDKMFSCFQLNKGKGSASQKMKNEEALALEALGNLHSAKTQTTTSTTPQETQPRANGGVVSHQPPRTAPSTAPTTGGVPTYAYPYPHPPHPGYMYPPHPGYHYPYGVPPTHDASQPVPYPMYPHYPPQSAVPPPPGTYPPTTTTESKEGQPPHPPYVPPYYYDYRYPYPPPQSGSVPPPGYPYPPQPGYPYPPHPEQSYPYPPHGYPMPYPPQMGYPPQPVQVQKTQPAANSTPVIVSNSAAESQPVTGTPCRTVSSSTSGEQTSTPVGSPQTKMVYQRETKVLHPVRYVNPPSPTETTAEITAKIKRERVDEQEEAAKKVRRDLQISNPLCSRPVSSQTVQNGPLSTPIKVLDK